MVHEYSSQNESGPIVNVGEVACWPGNRMSSGRPVECTSRAAVVTRYFGSAAMWWGRRTCFSRLLQPRLKFPSRLLRNKFPFKKVIRKFTQCYTTQKPSRQLYKRSGGGEVPSKISYIAASLLTLSPFPRARKSVQRCLISRGDTAL